MDILKETELTLEVNPEKLEELTKAVEDAVATIMDEGDAFPEMFVLLMSLAPQVALELGMDKASYLTWMSAGFDDSLIAEKEQEKKVTDINQLN